MNKRYLADVCIDPGHGYVDSGAIGKLPTGEKVEESTLNMQLGFRLRSALKNLGHSVIMTREKDIDPEKIVRAEKGSRAQVFVSIHCNSAGFEVKRAGMQVHVRTDKNRIDTPERILARFIVTRCEDVGIPMRPDPFKGDTDRFEGGFTVLRKCTSTAILIETGFMSEQKDLINLVDPEFQEKCARAWALGIQDFLKHTTEQFIRR